MTQYREILRLHSINLSQMNIAASCGASKKTVNKVLKAAGEHGISWPLDDTMTDAALEEMLEPQGTEGQLQQGIGFRRVWRRGAYCGGNSSEDQI